uniref:Uncharacterized protein n=1 Tax=Arundo donax TaxID=35708 RepID=A0A0A8ZG58_ARUDO
MCPSRCKLGQAMLCGSQTYFLIKLTGLTIVQLLGRYGLTITEEHLVL